MSTIQIGQSSRRGFLFSSIASTAALGFDESLSQAHDGVVTTSPSARRIFESRLSPPKSRIYNVATNESFQKAGEVLDVWREYDNSLNKSNNIETLKKFFYELTKKLGISSSYPQYSQTAFDEVVLVELKDYLAKLGVIAPPEMVRKLKGGTCFMYSIPQTIYEIKELRETSIRDLNGNEHSFQVVLVNEAIGDSLEASGFALYGTVFVVADIVKDEIRNLDEKLEDLKEVAPEVYNTLDREFWEATESIPDFLSKDFPNQMHLASLFSYGKLLLGLKRVDEKKYLETLCFHEGQHLVDKGLIELESIQYKGTFGDVKSNAYKEYRAKLNELQANPYYRLFHMSHHLRSSSQYLRAQNLSQLVSMHKKGILLSEVCMFKDIIDIVKSDPGQFGVKIRTDIPLSVNVQIVGQLHKLTEGNRPKLLFEKLKLQLTKTPEELFGELEAKLFNEQASNTNHIETSHITTSRMEDYIIGGGLGLLALGGIGWAIKRRMNLQEESNKQTQRRNTHRSKKLKRK